MKHLAEEKLTSIVSAQNTKPSEVAVTYHNSQQKNRSESRGQQKPNARRATSPEVKHGGNKMGAGRWKQAGNK
jgi:hypothetical protein